jgi:PAS domain S-box-containing protein
VLLDYRLPDRDGLEVLEELTADAEGQVPVVMLTGQGDESVAVQAMRRGAQDYLVKGRMTSAALAGAVQNAIARAALLKQVERARRRFRLAVEASPAAMVMAGADGRIVLVNTQTEHLSGYARAELIGLAFQALIPEGMLRPPADRPSAPASGGELRLRRKDGAWVPVEVGLNPIDTEDGPMVLASVVDVSERKRLEEERRALDRRVQEAQKFESLGVLAGGIAHRFNNLLVGVLGNASLAAMALPPESPARAALANLESSAQQIAELCRQMLAFSGRGRFVIQPLDLSALVAEMRPLLDVSVAHGAALRYDLAAAVPPAEADAAQIRQLIVNLVTNAAEALPESGGEVTLRTWALQRAPAGVDELAGGVVVLEVRDTGCGMDAATRARIFDPFFTTKFTGRGLGLAAVLGIVRGHRGAIEVDSAPGKGTSVRVYFPAVSAPAVGSPQGAIQRAPLAVPVSSSPRGGAVLVVDDEETVRNVTRATLESRGYTVLSAAGGQEAVEIVRARGAEVALVLLDLVMPGLGGDEVYLCLREIRPDLPVLLVSGYDEREATARFAALGLPGFIQKPWQVPALLARVRGLLGGGD